MNSVPTIENRGFMNLQLSAQALWFHLAVRARQVDDRWAVSETEAAATRKEIGASDEDVRALLRNGYLYTEGGLVYIREEGAFMPGPVVEQNGELQVLFVYPGSRMVYWRESLAKYRCGCAEDEKRRRERYQNDSL